MSDMRSPPLLQDCSEAHTRFHTELSRCAYVPLLQWRGCSVIPSWKVIVSAPRGQYSSRALTSPAFFLRDFFKSVVRIFHMMKFAAPLCLIDNGTSAPHHHPMITNPCATAMMKKASLRGALDRRAR